MFLGSSDVLNTGGAVRKADAGKVELQLIESAQLTSSESRPAQLHPLSMVVRSAWTRDT